MEKLLYFLNELYKNLQNIYENQLTFEFIEFEE